MKEHLPEINEDKLKIVLDIKDKYNSGILNLTEAKKILKEKVVKLKPYEIALAEQKLRAFDENECKKEDIQSMMQLFDEVMDTSRPELDRNHPIMCYYRENDEIKEVIERIKDLKEKVYIKNQWAEIYDKLTKWWKYHLARKQNQLYPLLEKKGFTRPTTTMWVLDDFVRDTIKEAKKLLDEDKDEEFLKFQNGTIIDVLDLIQKEETVLYPTSLAMIRNEEFEDMKIGDREIGFSLDDFDENSNKSPVNMTEKDSENKAGENNFANDLSKLLEKYGYSAGNNTVFDVATGKLTLEQINLIYKNLPVDITYVDENEIVKFYSDTKHRVFPRSKNVIGREVKNCHPRKSVHIVEEIIEKFRSGEQSTAEFWINKPEIFIYIYYVAVRDENGKFRGVLEMMQDCTHIRSLQGSRTLLTWDNENSTENKEELTNNIEEETSNLDINIDEINENTYLKDLLKKYPFLKEDMVKINSKFALLNTPLAKVMLPKATIAKMAEKSDMNIEKLIADLKELIKSKA